VKSPAFQFYPNDFLGSGSVAAMTLEEVGAYWILLCYDWNEEGLPNDRDRLSKWCRVSRKRFEAIWSVIGENFDLVDDRWRNNRLQIERQKQAENRTKKKHAAEVRWNASPVQVDSTCNARASDVQCSTSSTTSSTSVTTTATTPAASRRSSKPKSEPKYPHYPMSLSQKLHAEWQAEMEQNVDFAIFRRDTAKAFDKPDVVADNSEAQILETVVMYSILREKSPERIRGLYTPAKWAGEFPRLLRLVAMPMSVDGLPTEKARLVFEGAAA
jgi:uncharacterized protein YdaU (DUF1376 family)